MKSIPICLITDNNYVIPGLVTILSIYRNREAETLYDINLITTEELTRTNKDAIKECGVPIKVVRANYNKCFKEIALLSTRHVTIAALYKFNLAEMFPQYEKLLYLDTDILVLKDLSLLFNIELKDHYAAVVESFTANSNSSISFEHNFNSGVMLLNTKKMREDDISRKLIDYRMYGDNYYMDQDAFNAVFEGKVKFLSILYNLMYTSTYRFASEDICLKYRIPIKNSWSELVCDSYILHFNSPYKPWKYIDVWMGGLWDCYYRLLPETIRRQYKLKRTLNPNPQKTNDISFYKYYLMMSPKRHCQENESIMVSLVFLLGRLKEHFVCKVFAIACLVKRILGYIKSVLINVLTKFE